MNGKTKHIISLIVLFAAAAVIILLIKGHINSTPAAETENTAQDTQSASAATDSYTPVSEDTSGQSAEAPDTSAPEQDDRTLSETADAGSDYIEKIIFIGDKTIYQLGRYTYTGIPDPVHQVWSTEENIPVTKISSVNNFLYPETLEAMNFIDAAKRKAPPYIILTFGSYDPNGELTKETLFSSLGTFAVNLKAASPNSQIMIQSVFPVGYDCETVDFETVRIRNSWLREFCSSYKLYYLNTWSILADENGCLKPDYYDTDGYLLNEKGYETVVKYIRTHAHPSYSLD